MVPAAAAPLDQTGFRQLAIGPRRRQSGRSTEHARGLRTGGRREPAASRPSWMRQATWSRNADVDRLVAGGFEHQGEDGIHRVVHCRSVSSAGSSAAPVVRCAGRPRRTPSLYYPLYQSRNVRCHFGCRITHRGPNWVCAVHQYGGPRRPTSLCRRCATAARRTGRASSSRRAIATAPTRWRPSISFRPGRGGRDPLWSSCTAASVAAQYDAGDEFLGRCRRRVRFCLRRAELSESARGAGSPGRRRRSSTPGRRWWGGADGYRTSIRGAWFWQGHSSGAGRHVVGGHHLSALLDGGSTTVLAPGPAAGTALFGRSLTDIAAGVRRIRAETRRSTSIRPRCSEALRGVVRRPPRAPAASSHAGRERKGRERRNTAAKPLAPSRKPPHRSGPQAGPASWEMRRATILWHRRPPPTWYSDPGTRDLRMEFLQSIRSASNIFGRRVLIDRSREVLVRRSRRRPAQGRRPRNSLHEPDAGAMPWHTACDERINAKKACVVVRPSDFGLRPLHRILFRPS